MYYKGSITYLIILIFIYLFSVQLIAGAWVQKQGSTYLRIYSSYLFSTGEFNYKGLETDLYEEHLGYGHSYFRDISVVIYSEYGLTEHLTLIGELPFKSLTTKRTIVSTYGGIESATNSGFADLKLSGKLKIIQHPFVLAFQSGLGIPLGYEKQPANNGPRLGSGDLSFEAHILLGSSFYPLPLYFSGSAGYRFRNGELNDEMIFTAEIGLTLGNFFIKTYAEILRNVVTPPDIYGQRIETPLPGGGGDLPDIVIGDQHLTKIIPSVTYQINDRFGIQAELIKPISGRNALSGSTWSLGLVFGT